MRKVINCFFLLLGIIVLIDWAAHLAGIFSANFGPGRTGPQLTEIDFKLFSDKIEKNYISQGYGGTLFALFSYIHPWHNGIDIVAPLGTPIHSATEGIVFYAGNQDQYCYHRAYGKFIVIKNENDDRTLFYAHLLKISVDVGDKVKAGDIIGRVGQSGFATGPHLHLSVFKTSSFGLPAKNGCGPYPTGEDTNPIPYLKSLNS